MPYSSTLVEIFSELDEDYIYIYIHCFFQRDTLVHMHGGDCEIVIFAESVGGGVAYQWC